MAFAEFARAAGLIPLSGTAPESFRGVYAGDLLSRAMSRVEAGQVWITIMNHVNVVAVASLTGAVAVILAEGVLLTPEALAAAREQKIAVFSSPKSAYELCCLAAAAEGR